MISCTLQGRTGNQLFQIAAAYAHAKRHGFEFISPPVSLNETLWPSHRFSKLKYGKMQGKPYNEPHFHYAEIPVEDNLILNGYFQTSKYFDEYRGELLEIFDLAPKKIPGTCAVHIRRGDYITFNKQFNLLPVKWYKDAIELVKEKHPETDFHFFSDDINWCQKHFDFGTFHNGLPMVDLRAGVACEHHIMSASSFSWWMAYAGKSDTQMVIVSNTWFGEKNQHHNTQDLYEPNWIRC